MAQIARTRTIYFADDKLWAESRTMADEYGMSHSAFIADAIRNQVARMRFKAAIPDEVAIRYVQTRLGDYKPE